MVYNAKVYSKLGQCGSVFGLSLMDECKKWPIKVLSADMSVVAGLGRFKDVYHDSFFNVGIAEQNLIGMSAGFSSEGFMPIAVAQATFITMRCFEQVRQYLGYMHYKVIVVGINSGFALTFFGSTHYAIEDMAVMRSIPNMVVLSPADAGSAVMAFESALKCKEPVYIRLTGGLNCPIVYKEPFDYQIGKSNVIIEGTDVVIYATGVMVSHAIKAVSLLQTSSISVKVVDMHTIKPIDRMEIEADLDCKLMVSLEEHNVIGGLGGAVSEVLSDYANSPVLLKLGVHDAFGTVGDYEYLLSQNRLLPDQIAEDIKNKYEQLYKI